MWDYGVIVTMLRQFSKKLDEDSTKRSEVKGWLRKLEQFKFVAIMLLSTDVHFESKFFSKTTQSDSNTVIEYVKGRQKYHASITKLKTTLGTEVENSIAELASGTFKGVEIKFTSTKDKTASGLRKMILGWQNTLVNKMLERFDHYLPDIDVINKLAGLLDLRDIVSLFNNNSDSREDDIETWGDAEAAWLVENIFPSLDIYTHSLRVKLWLRGASIEHFTQ